MGEDVAPERDVDAADVHAAGECFDLIARVLVSLLAAVGEVHFRVRDVTAVPDLAGALGRVRAHHPDPRHLASNPLEETFHGGPHGGVVNPLLGVEHDLGLHAGALAEP